MWCAANDDDIGIEIEVVRGDANAHLVGICLAPASPELGDQDGVHISCDQAVLTARTGHRHDLAIVVLAPGLGLALLGQVFLWRQRGLRLTRHRRLLVRAMRYKVSVAGWQCRYLGRWENEINPKWREGVGCVSCLSRPQPPRGARVARRPVPGARTGPGRR